MNDEVRSISDLLMDSGMRLARLSGIQSQGCHDEHAASAIGRELDVLRAIQTQLLARSLDEAQGAGHG